MRRDILYKFFEGKASPKEQRLIGQWLDESEKHKEVLVRERMVFDAMIVSGGITDSNRYKAVRNEPGLFSWNYFALRL
jgi:transmembrane sensor